MSLRPYSPHFEEHYWSPAGGVAEKQAVFVEGCRLPASFAALPPGDVFRLGELGFGTGLNMALAAACFATHAPQGARLELFSTEAFPLGLSNLEAIHAELAEGVQPFLTPLRAGWMGLQRGWNSMQLAENILLQLWCGEAAEGVQAMPPGFGAWFLDGFSPAKNPAMWSASLMQQLAARSLPGTKVATYSVARMVRDNLSAAGFEVRKVKGVPPKRDRLEGEMLPKPQAAG